MLVYVCVYLYKSNSGYVFVFTFVPFAISSTCASTYLIMQNSNESDNCKTDQSPQPQMPT